MMMPLISEGLQKLGPGHVIKLVMKPVDKEGMNFLRVFVFHFVSQVNMFVGDIDCQEILGPKLFLPFSPSLSLSFFFSLSLSLPICYDVRSVHV